MFRALFVLLSRREVKRDAERWFFGGAESGRCNGG